MKAGLLLNSDHRINSYSEKYHEILRRNKIPLMVIDPNSGTLTQDLRQCTHLVFRHSQGDTDIKLYSAIFNIASSIPLKCLPDLATFWPYEDKVREYYLLRSNELPVVESRVFWNSEPAAEYLATAAYPLVAKLPKGASSSNVVKISSVDEGRILLRQVFGRGVGRKGLESSSSLKSAGKTGLVKYGKRLLRNSLISVGVIHDKTHYPEWQIQKDSILFQKYLHGNPFDTRVTVIGKRAFAFRRFVRKGDFRASGSGKVNNNPERIDKRCVRMAFQVSEKMKFTTMAYDFIYDEDNNPRISEISYCFTDSFLETCPGFWDEKLAWHPGHNWPQYYQLVDFLEKSDLKPV